MKKAVLIFIFLLSFIPFNISSQTISPAARWITVSDGEADKANTWIAFKKDFSIKKVSSEALARIAVDSKYWLWVNGEMVIFEGGLKRGPSPDDTYYDEVDLSPYLKKGVNQIAILVWYFGKEGFSHKDSGKAGLIFCMKNNDVELVSDNSWLSRIHPAYKNTGEPHPNYRLPESNIHFDANVDIKNWQTSDCKAKFGFSNSAEIGKWSDAPWNELVKRPIPFWKDYGITMVPKYERRKGGNIDTLIVDLPYNMQMTPVIDITDKAGNNLISIQTDHLYGGSDISVRAEYMTTRGTQKYESLGWINGHKLILTMPSHIILNEVGYRETGYAISHTGSFYCDNDFYMRFWKKALRTLYVNMRDTYFDCPDRERAQWWGDVVLLMSESFYTYSSEVHDLSRKAIYELINWQREDGRLFSPVPAGNYKNELPGQMLASIGYYGFWNYYMNTADLKTIKDIYPGLKKYLSLWKLDDTGLTELRRGEWTWGDWGGNKDIRLIFAGWHYLALKGAANMAAVLGYEQDTEEYKKIMEKVKTGYNKCWNGFAYRHPEYHDKTDDRVQALAVISGIADNTQYNSILNILKTQFHASPYMEKYVMEALFIMGEGKYALERTKKRFTTMVDNPGYTTLFEGWDVGGFGGGTVNHAWSGGALTIIAQYVCGIYPLEPGYKVFKIEPYPASFNETSISIPTKAGMIKSEFKLSENDFTMKIEVPDNTLAVLYLQKEQEKNIFINNSKMDIKGKYKANDKYRNDKKTTCQLPAGEYTIVIK